jgi:nitrite reductase (NADH) large subunit
VTVLERGDRLLRREVDATCSDLVADHFARAGIEIMRRSEATHVVGTPAVSHVVLKDNHTLGCDVFLAATGIRSNVDLARQAGVSVRRGVLVDERMQTRVSGVFAAGDVAEQDGQVPGRWPIAMEQAKLPPSTRWKVMSY